MCTLRKSDQKAYLKYIESRLLWSLHDIFVHIMITITDYLLENRYKVHWSQIWFNIIYDHMKKLVGSY